VTAVAVLAGKASPGATTVAPALTLTWPRAVLLVDADPAGGDVVPGLLPGRVSTESGLLSWSVATRHRPALDAAASIGEDAMATSPGPGQPAGGVPCPGNGADTGNPAAPASPTPGPGGLTLTGSSAGNAAATFAVAQIGKPYVWGAQGPGSFDCSGLTMAAWASASVTIPRVTYTQASTGTPLSVQDARTGDLVLIPGSDGTAANPGHVGMVAGVDTTGKVWLVEAPRTGLTVRLTPISGWANQIVTIRRIG